MRRAPQVIFIAGLIGFALTISLLPPLPSPVAKGVMPSLALRQAPWPLPLLIGLGASLVCIFAPVPFLARPRREPPARSDTDAQDQGSADAEQGAIAQTLRRLDDLSTLPEGQVPSAETLRRARAYVSDIDSILSLGGTARGGAAWQVPEVSRGQGGSVVLLWQDGGRYLSLSFRDADGLADSGLADWAFDPGRAYGDIAMLDFTHGLQRASASPAEFIGSVWEPWSGGHDPVTA